MKANMPKIMFGGKEFYIIDKFKYEQTVYAYIMQDVYEEGVSIENLNADIEVNFIYKCEDGGYKNVVDDELFNKLMTIASDRIIRNEAEYLKMKG